MGNLKTKSGKPNYTSSGGDGFDSEFEKSLFEFMTMDVETATAGVSQEENE